TALGSRRETIQSEERATPGPPTRYSDETPRAAAIAGDRHDECANRSRTAKADAGGRLPQQRYALECRECSRFPPGIGRNRLRRGTKRGDRVSLGRGPL